jgi:hypothetical protein
MVRALPVLAARTKPEYALTMEDKQKNAEKVAESSSDQTPQSTRKGPVRSGEERRKVNIPPPPGSPARSGKDRRSH